MAFVDRQKGSLVLFSNGAIVDRGNCPVHVRHKKGRCICRLIVRIVYADQKLAHGLFDLTVEKWSVLS